MRLGLEGEAGIALIPPEQNGGAGVGSEEDDGSQEVYGSQVERAQDDGRAQDSGA